MKSFIMDSILCSLHHPSLVIPLSMFQYPQQLIMPQSVFFDRYPHFQQIPVGPLGDEFERLALVQRWRKGTRKWKIYRKECFDAEFELHLGSIENGKLAGWQALCQELGINGNLPSITQCKKVKKADNTV